ncbi:hypothetical protein DY000_02023829 [Brassica cretica]|uniref:Uncharacterized protein n=1 Tax=Brassica cretica TaxID=69181 RepID=A0ABQ7ECF9_BRACR|nr:hypothetical protein DY000_02023829 [Brassica cretica]
MGGEPRGTVQDLGGRRRQDSRGFTDLVKTKVLHTITTRIIKDSMRSQGSLSI